MKDRYSKESMSNFIGVCQVQKAENWNAVQAFWKSKIFTANMNE
jgi:hypothetical protein